MASTFETNLFCKDIIRSFLFWFILIVRVVTAVTPLILVTVMRMLTHLFHCMAIYRSGEYSMKFSKAIREQLVKKQRDFMPEDVTAGKIVEFLARTDHDRVCCQMLHTEALDRLGEPKKWESHKYCEIMKNYAPEWRRFDTARSFGPKYGKQKGWERVGDADDTAFIINQPRVNQLHFTQITTEEALAQGMPPEFLSDAEGKLTA